MALDRDLTQYEIEVGEAMTVRRDAARRLWDLLAEDMRGYGDGMVAVREGRAMDIFAPRSAGEVRQRMSDAVNEFEATRHGFRLAMVAMAVDNGRTIRQIAETFMFSRQLASRYLKEARTRWPDLQPTAIEPGAAAGATPAA